MQVKIIIGTVAFMLTMVLLGFYALLEPARLENFTEARLGRQIESGASLYYANCATCHGVNGLGSNGGECYDSATGEPIACQGLPLNWRALQCEVDAGKTARMIDRGWAGTKYGFIHDTIASGRQGGVMPAWGQLYGGPLQENEVDNVTLFVMNWESEELCDFVPVLFPWPWPDEEPDAAYAALPEVDEEAVREANPDLAAGEALPFELPMLPGDAARGAELYPTYGCNACHGNPEGDAASANVGPWHGNLGNVAGDRIPGVSAEGYLYQSILVPEAYIVEGYANAMQSYADQMGDSPQDLVDIIAYLLTLQAGE